MVQIQQLSSLRQSKPLVGHILQDQITAQHWISRATFQELREGIRRVPKFPDKERVEERKQPRVEEDLVLELEGAVEEFTSLRIRRLCLDHHGKCTLTSANDLGNRKKKE